MVEDNFGTKTASGAILAVQKMEAIAPLPEELAHDFNNLPHRHPRKRTMILADFLSDGDKAAAASEISSARSTRGQPDTSAAHLQPTSADPDRRLDLNEVVAT